MLLTEQPIIAKVSEKLKITGNLYIDFYNKESYRYLPSMSLTISARVASK